MKFITLYEDWDKEDIINEKISREYHEKHRKRKSKIEFWIRKNIDRKHLRQWSLTFTAFIMVAVVPLFVYRVLCILKDFLRQRTQQYRNFVKEKEEWENKTA